MERRSLSEELGILINEEVNQTLNGSFKHKKRKRDGTPSDLEVKEELLSPVMSDTSSTKSSKKKKKTFDDGEIKDEVLSPVCSQTIKTKASSSSQTFPFNGELVLTSHINEATGESSESLETSKKHKKKRQNEKDSLSEMESDTSTKKKKKKKKLDGGAITEDFLSEDSSAILNESLHITDEHIEDDDMHNSIIDFIHRKKKKKKSEEESSPERKKHEISENLETSSDLGKNKLEKKRKEKHVESPVSQELPNSVEKTKNKDSSFIASDPIIEENEIHDSINEVPTSVHRKKKKKSDAESSPERKKKYEISESPKTSDSSVLKDKSEKKRKEKLIESPVNKDLFNNLQRKKKKEKKGSLLSDSVMSLDYPVNNTSLFSSDVDVEDNIRSYIIMQNGNESDLMTPNRKKRENHSKSVNENIFDECNTSTPLKNKEHKESSDEVTEEGQNDNESDLMTKKKKRKDEKHNEDINESILNELSSSTPVKKEENKENCNKTIGEEQNTTKKIKASRVSKVFKKYTPKNCKDECKSEIRVMLEDVREKTRFNDEQIQVLDLLRVEVPWEVPPLHLIETRIANRPTDAQNKAIEALNVEVKKGNFSQTEDHQLKKNWKKFCKVHGLPMDPTPFLTFITSKKQITVPTEQRVKFVRFLAHKLDNRLLCTVYKRFKRLYQQPTLKTGRFSEEENNIIVNFMKHTGSGTPYSDLAKILNRDRLAVEKRCVTLMHKYRGTDSNIKWKKSKIEEFMKEFVDLLNVGDVEELKDRQITNEEWKEMSKRLNVPSNKLRQAWYCTIYPRLFIPPDVDFSSVMQRLVEILIKRGETDWRAVDWNAVTSKFSEEFQGFTKNKLYSMLKHVVSYHVAEDSRGDLKKCLMHLDKVVLKKKKIFTRKMRGLKVIDNREDKQK